MSDTHRVRLLKTSSAESVTLDFPLGAVVNDVAARLYAEWPESFPEGDKVTSADVIKFLFNGRFLDGSASLASLGVKADTVPTFHVMVRPSAKAKSKPARKAAAGTPRDSANQQPAQGGCCVVM